MLHERLVGLLGKRVTLRLNDDKKHYEGILSRQKERGRSIWVVSGTDGEEVCRGESSDIIFVEGVDLRRK